MIRMEGTYVMERDCDSGDYLWPLVRDSILFLYNNSSSHMIPENNDDEIITF